MKNSIFELLVGLFLGNFFLLTKAEVIQTTEPVPVLRGPHSQVVQWTTVSRDENGVEITSTNQVTELAGGMNRWDAATDSWVPAEVDIEVVNGHGVSRKTQHQIIFAADITDLKGTVDMLLPDGVTRFIAEPIGLAYTDATGASVFIAETKSTVGELIGKNQVVYFDAFDEIKADVRMIVTLDGFEQDIILRETPPDPAVYGLDPATTRLEGWTLVMNNPNRVIRPRLVQQAANKERVDHLVDFGSMEMQLGKAFSIGSSDRGAFVVKEWATLEGLNFLVEKIDYVDIKPDLDKLPAPVQAKVINKQKQIEIAAKADARKRTKPHSLSAKKQDSTSKAVASISRGTWTEAPGYIIDYTTVSTDKSNFTFNSGETYYVTGPITFSGTNTTFEAGTVIKLSPTNSPKMKITSTALTWQGEDFKPVVITARDNHVVGEKIGTAALTNSPYANIALEIEGPVASIQNLRITHATNAIVFNTGAGHSIKHTQLMICNVGIKATGNDFTVQNALFHRVLTNFLAVKYRHGEG